MSQFQYGLEHCPKEYDTLRIRLLCHQNYDMHPTLTRVELWADDYKFLAPTASYCDLSTLVAGVRVLTTTANRIKYGQIPTPKRIVIEVHNPFLFFALTGQIDILTKRTRLLTGRVNRLIKSFAPTEVRLVNLDELAARRWTGTVNDWRDNQKFVTPIDLTPIETQEALQVLYKKAKQSKMRALHER